MIQKSDNNELDICNSNILQKIATAWDKNVELRSKELFDCTDESYISIITPWVLNTAIRVTNEQDNILDIGCGCGYLANQLFLKGRPKIIGIDISEKSIILAKSQFPQISFTTQNFYTYKTDVSFKLCIAVMVMNNTPDIYEFCQQLYSMLDDDGRVIIVIPHPCFWPQKHIKNIEYSYLKETTYDFRFSTKNQKNYPSNVFYFHRPLEIYLDYFKHFGFEIEHIAELPEIMTKENPDIIGFILKKTDKL